MTLALIAKILLIVVIVALGVTFTSYMIELHRYISYLEKKIEREQAKKLTNGLTEELNKIIRE